MAKKLTQEEFIEKAKAVHGDRYNYESLQFINTRTSVDIMCPVHGVFTQNPKSHLKGNGCRKCAIAATVGKLKGRKTAEEVVKEMQKIHDSKYEYDMSNYVNKKSKATITCPTHGVFEQTISDHLSGYGCPKCGVENISTKLRSSTKEFVSKAIKVHEESYTYSKTDYVNAKTKVIITCPTHGDFTQTPNDHLNGCGCYRCGTERMGWTDSKWEEQGKNSTKFTGYKLYVVKLWKDGEVFYKIGKTFVSYAERFSRIGGYRYEVLYEVAADAKTVCELERKYHADNKNYTYKPNTPFNGHSECFTKVELKDRGLNYGC